LDVRLPHKNASGKIAPFVTFLYDIVQLKKERISKCIQKDGWNEHAFMKFQQGSAANVNKCEAIHEFARDGDVDGQMVLLQIQSFKESTSGEILAMTSKRVPAHRQGDIGG
jgi:hypothetical protein